MQGAKVPEHRRGIPAEKPVLGWAPTQRSTSAARRATATCRHGQAQQETFECGPTSLPQGSWNVMPAATQKLGHNFRHGCPEAHAQRRMPGGGCREADPRGSLVPGRRFGGRCPATSEEVSIAAAATAGQNDAATPVKQRSEAQNMCAIVTKCRTSEKGVKT